MNGSVAFLLPLIFILKTMERREIDHHRRLQIKKLFLLGIISDINKDNKNLFIENNVSNNIHNNRIENDKNTEKNENNNTSESEKNKIPHFDYSGGKEGSVLYREGSVICDDDHDNGYGHDEVRTYISLTFF